MEPQNHHIWVLITRVLSGEADTAEEDELRQWLEEDSTNRQFFEELKSSWQQDPHENAADAAFLFDYESGLEKLRNKLEDEKKLKKHAGLKLVSPAETSQISAWKWAASLLLLIAAISVWAAIHYWHPAATTYATSQMEQHIVTLPDGSKVRLNRNSKISFARGFSGSTRKISLTGEAFFRVQHNPDKPFVIHAGNAVIKDIGTSFDVKKENNGKVIVAVKSGKASLQNRNKSGHKVVVLTKGQIGILNQKGGISKISQANIQNYWSWISGRVAFKNMPLGQVSTQLDNIYGIHCRLADSSLASMKLTAYIKNTSLHQVLHMIALTLGIEYRKNGRKVIWLRKSSDSLRTHRKSMKD